MIFKVIFSLVLVFPILSQANYCESFMASQSDFILRNITVGESFVSWPIDSEGVANFNDVEIKVVESVDIIPELDSGLMHLLINGEVVDLAETFIKIGGEFGVVNSLDYNQDFFRPMAALILFCGNVFNSFSVVHYSDGVIQYHSETVDEEYSEYTVPN